MVLTAVATFAFAQGPEGMGWFAEAGAPPIDELKAYLGLTDTQITALQTIRQQQRDSMQQARTDLRTKEKALGDLLNSTSPDPTAVGRAVLEIQTLRQSLRKNDTSLQDQARAILNDAQKTKLATLEAAAGLRDEIQQATMLHLLARPEPPAGMVGPAMMRPGMMGGAMRGQRGPRH